MLIIVGYMFDLMIIHFDYPVIFIAITQQNQSVQI